MSELLHCRVLITGVNGFIGSSLIKRIAEKGMVFGKIVGCDVRSISNTDIAATDSMPQNYEFIKIDVRDPDIVKVMDEFAITHVVHLASIVTPGKDSNREFEYSVDVLGTKNILAACVHAQKKVQKIIVTSSGAAYGYHADNPAWLSENDELRGNDEFAYSDHKKLVEFELAEYRKIYPELQQLVLRPGTILGMRVNNQITALFKQRLIIGVMKSDAPFVFIWDEDVVEIIIQGIVGPVTGIFNLVGDGAITLPQIASFLHKPYLPIPAIILKVVLWLLKFFKLSNYGPEQVRFLQYRPVLSNEKLKHEFPYLPKYSSLECFMMYRKSAKI